MWNCDVVYVGCASGAENLKYAESVCASIGDEIEITGGLRSLFVSIALYFTLVRSGTRVVQIGSE